MLYLPQKPLIWNMPLHISNMTYSGLRWTHRRDCYMAKGWYQYSIQYQISIANGKMWYVSQKPSIWNMPLHISNMTYSGLRWTHGRDCYMAKGWYQYSIQYQISIANGKMWYVSQKPSIWNMPLHISNMTYSGLRWTHGRDCYMAKGWYQYSIQYQISIGKWGNFLFRWIHGWDCYMAKGWYQCSIQYQIPIGNGKMLYIPPKALDLK